MNEQLPKEERLRAELEKRAFHRGDGEFAKIEYCDFCGYSRSWIADHGHGKDCILWQDLRLERNR